MTDAKVIPLPIYNFRLPAHMLRRLADEIDNGDHGTNPEMTVILFGKRLHIYAAGDAFGDHGVAAGASAILCTSALRLLTDHVITYEEP